MIKKIALTIAISMLCMPLANAEPTGYRIRVVDHSKYIKNIDYKLLYEYLYSVSVEWPIHNGVYSIYLEDYLPNKGTNPLPAKTVGYHLPGPVAYINVKKAVKLGIDPYVVITHELAEMAVDPNLDYLDNNGDNIEICDDDNGSIMIWENHLVAPFLTQSEYFDLHGGVITRVP